MLATSKPFATLLHLDYLQRCCTNREDGLHPAKMWRTSKHYKNLCYPLNTDANYFLPIYCLYCLQSPILHFFVK